MSGAGTPAAGDAEPASLPAIPPHGILVARIEIDAWRLGEVARAVERGPVYLCGSEVRGPTASGMFEEDIYLEYAGREDVDATLRRLGDIARGVSALRAWCPHCASWHDLARDGRRMRAPEGAPCRATPPGLAPA